MRIEQIIKKSFEHKVSFILLKNDELNRLETVLNPTAKYKCFANQTVKFKTALNSMLKFIS